MPADLHVDLQLEVLPTANGQQRDAAVAAVAADDEPMDISDSEEDDDDGDDDEDGVRVLLCDEGPGGGGMGYYLGSKFHQPAVDAAAKAPQDEASRALAIERQSSTAEVVAQDENIEHIMSQFQFVMDDAEPADTPWRQMTANLQDYFNYNLDERSFKELITKQIRMRLEARQRRKLGVSSERGMWRD
eukprot:gnl/TRDRNA2_/TRDRNA2_182720_c0_seq1.p1 gnl/TRDRNA2_/TRDRNA2_182720_c0~~gnl/TRDRNA2_/TRDRNA2_182720_c0_seq1.p1  ORF type:complete len:197 (+),score=61.95 gnl/TRDRNA2_/TRDRNA2_182720_c0_seq1:30-593(+)